MQAGMILLFNKFLFMRYLCIFLLLTAGLTLRAQIFQVQPASFLDCSQGGLSWGDYDKDGDLDVIMAGVHETGTATCLYRNKDGAFTKQTTSFAALSLGSANWGDYDNDDDMDLLLCGTNPIGEGSTILYRNDNGAFTPSGVSITGIAAGEAIWLDYNKDGFLDILISGDTLYNNPVTKLYKNNGDGTFTHVPQNIVACLNSFIAAGDYDNDGDQDLLISGAYDTSYITKIYRNDDGIFHESGINLFGVAYSNGLFVDIDHDQDLDIIYMGATMLSDYAVKIYFNDGNGGFVSSSDTLEGEWVGRIDAADLNNDGFPDLGITGSLCCGDALSRIYMNDGTGHFNLASVSLPDLYFSQINFGDFDNDGDADFLLFGIPPDGPGTTMTRLYRNMSNTNTFTVNTPPGVPAGLSASVDDHDVTFSWLAPADNTTPAPALTYSLITGTSSGVMNVMPAPSNPENGFYKVYSPGNVGHNTSWIIKDLPTGSYQCSIQALDQSGSASAFSPEVSFEVGTIGIGEKDAISPVMLSPNPVRGNLTIKVSDLFSDGDFIIFNGAGRKILSGKLDGKTIMVDMQPFPAGIYEIQVRKNTQIASNRYINL